MFRKSKAIVTFLTALMLAMLPPAHAPADDSMGQWYPVENIPNCKFWLPFSGKKGSAKWAGKCVDGLVHGRGVLKLKKGSYEGKFKKGKLQRYGLFLASDRIKFVGEFKDTSMQGKGILVVKDMYRYEGEFKNNDMDGYGVQEYPDGSRYEGEFRKSMMHGQGVIVVNDMYRYEGEFKDNDKDGYGVQVFLDGSRYVGLFLNGWRHGHGVWTLRDEKKCEGEWDKGQLVGLAKGWVNGQPKACVTEDYAVKFLD